MWQEAGGPFEEAIGKSGHSVLLSYFLPSLPNRSPATPWESSAVMAKRQERKVRMRTAPEANCCHMASVDPIIDEGGYLPNG